MAPQENFLFQNYPKILFFFGKVLQIAVKESDVLELVNDGYAAKRKDGIRVQDLRERPKGIGYYGFKVKLKIFFFLIFSLPFQSI